MDEDKRGVERPGDASAHDADTPGGTVSLPAAAPAPGHTAEARPQPSEPRTAGGGPRPPCPRKTALAAIVAALVVTVAIAAAALTYHMELWGGVSVPQVTGASVTDAAGALTQAGFAVERVEVPTDDGAGTVLGTEPAAGVRVARGGTVRLRVGVPRMVPKVTGKNLQDAQAELSQAGISNLRLEYRNSDEAEGTVLDVLPDEGSVVTLDDEVVLVIAQPYTVPDVVGLDQDGATKAIGEAGLRSKIEWQESDKDAYTVLSTSPAAGARASSGATVTVSVSSPGARSETYLPDYLRASPKGVASYLQWKGWSFDFGTTAQLPDGTSVAEEGWSKPGVGSLVFTPAPESSRHGIFLGSIFTRDVLSEGTPIAGVRYVPARTGGDANPSVDSATVNGWMQRCGLSGLSGTVTGDDVVAAVAGAGAAPNMICGWGTQGDTVWSVAVIEGRGVAVSCAKSSVYDDVNLDGYGASLGIYLAYTAGFTA